MRLTYDPKVDALYIYIRDDNVRSVDSVDLEPGISADLDENGNVLGIEILNAREKSGSDAPVGISFELLGSESISALS